jgi:hypothetical protein
MVFYFIGIQPIGIRIAFTADLRQTRHFINAGFKEDFEADEC